MRKAMDRYWEQVNASLEVVGEVRLSAV